MGFVINGNNPLEIDMSDVSEKLMLMQMVLTQQQFEKMMYRTFAEVGRKTKTIIAKDVTVDYAVTQAWVKSKVKPYKLGFGGEFPVTCKIPLSGEKGVIGDRFKLSGRKRKITAKIVKSNISELPMKMENQGGNPPFVIKGKVYTRKTRKRFPVVRVVGLGVPQMPLTRSEDAVRSDILDYIDKRLDHHFIGMFGGGY